MPGRDFVSIRGKRNLRRYGDGQQGDGASLYDHDELRFVASLRVLFEPSHEENKTIFVVLEDEKVAAVSKIVNDVTGGLDHPDTGILFTVPVQHIEGLGAQK